MPRKSSKTIPFAASTMECLRPPPDLDDADARSLFVDIVCACRADFFEASDAPLLAAYCKAVVLERTASAGLKDDGYVLRDGKPSPWLPLLQAATRTMSTYSRMLKLNPAGRHSPLNSPKEPPLPVSYFDRMGLLQERRDDEPGTHQ
jgi:phage terminase small subunit